MYVNTASVMAIGILFPVLGTIAVTARFIVRQTKNIGLGIDDWLCLPALVKIILIATGAIYIAGAVTRSIGVNSPPQTVAELLLDESPTATRLLKFESIIDIMNPVGTGCIRLSFLFFYRRIFRGRSFNIVSWTMICIVVAWMIAFFVGHLAACGTQFSALWANQNVIFEKCWEGRGLLFLAMLGITSFILDLIILSLPFFWIWRLHMKTSQKLAVSSVFFFGMFTVGVGAVRMVGNLKLYTYKFNVEYDVLGTKGVNDLYGTVSTFLFWQYIENGTGMVVCCLPTLKPIVNTKPFMRCVDGLHQASKRFTRLGSASNRNLSADTLTGSTGDILPTNEIKVTMTVQLDTADRSPCTEGKPQGFSDIEYKGKL